MGGFVAGSKGLCDLLRNRARSLIYTTAMPPAAAAAALAALEVVRDTAKFLGAGVANLLNIFNPDTFVILGGVTLAGDHLFVPLQAEIKRRAFKPAVEACRVLAGTLPGTAGVFGAAATFRNQTRGKV